MLNLSYPASPSISNLKFLDPKPEFVQQVGRVTGAILLFMLVYLALIAGGLGLVYGCVKISLVMLGASINKFTIIIALGLIGLSLMFLLFLIKFIFSVKKHDLSDSLEITPQDHPRLFAFIDRLTEELQAPKPKRIFLIPDVNASVFYNSSFWSMFLPVRKNLNIGLGFVNAVNLSEFKAVLAHEFGHFSQRSMKLGSYVYTVNHVIYNLVFEYDRWDRTLHGWAAEGGFFSIFANLTELLVNLVRKLLRFMYSIINKRNMSLSREMEYNADLVAVSAAGGNAMISALRRVGFGSAAYHTSIDALNNGLKDQQRIDNFYELHTAMLNRMANLNEIAVEHGLPVISDEQYQKAYRSGRVVFKDQWASHPDQEDREANINTAAVQAEIDHSSPWQLFEEPAALQRKMTSHLYRNANLSADYKSAFAHEFIETIEKQSDKYKVPALFNGFYDNRLLMDFDRQEALRHFPQELKFDEVFSEENAAMVRSYFSNHQDRQTLEHIKEGAIDTASFDFDGVKYKKKQAAEVLAKLEAEIEAQKKWFKEVEEKAFSYHYQLASKQGKGQVLLDKYDAYFKLAEERDKYQPFADEANQHLMRLQNTVQWSEDDAMRLIEDLHSLRRKVEATLGSSEAVSLPFAIGDHPSGKSLATYLMPEKLATLPSTSFDPESFNKLYQQVHEIYSRANNLSLDSMMEVLRFQEQILTPAV